MTTHMGISEDQTVDENIMNPNEKYTIEQIKKRRYECFIDDHPSKPWHAGQCAGYAGRGLHLMRCKRKDGHGKGGLFCKQHAATNGY